MAAGDAEDDFHRGRFMADTLHLDDAGDGGASQRAFAAADIKAALENARSAVGVEGGAHAVGVFEDGALVIDDVGAFREGADASGIIPCGVGRLAVGIGTDALYV